MEHTAALGYRVPIVLEPQSEGGFTVTSPALPELVTEGDTVEEAMNNVRDAFHVVLEIYEDEGRPLPAAIAVISGEEPITTEQLLAAG
jgi:antitoxin HicB